ncbi:DMT family transporter [Kiloniella sp. b19]|uniref:DMT family transporter n=1 Tax=Kiloniella sp. GXU_MW_B19 TaxID=3141326 RepID=UPI0031D56206
MQNSQSSSVLSLATLSPIIFVLIWSSGFVFAKFALPYAETFTLLATRFALVVAIMLPVALLTRAKWPGSWKETFHIAVAGMLLQAGYLGGVFAAIEQGLQAGATALIVGTQPLLVAFFARFFLNETVSFRQWTGLFVGVTGVILVVWTKLMSGLGTTEGIILALIALVTISAGTLYQKKYCGTMDLRSGSVIQYAASVLVCAPIAYATETMVIVWSSDFILGMAWLVLALSVGAITILFVLIRQGEASRVSSLFFMVPPTAALFAWLWFDETFGPMAMVGMVLTALGVALVTLKGRSQIRDSKTAEAKG